MALHHGDLVGQTHLAHQLGDALRDGCVRRDPRARAAHAGAAEAWLAVAVAGTASSTTATQAVSSRDFLDKTRQARV